MKITFDARQASKTLAIATAAVERKTTIPILSHVLIETIGDGITITATDLEKAIRLTLAATVQDPGSACLPAERLRGYLDTLSGEATLTTDDQHYARIVCGRARTRIPGMSRESYPELPAMPDDGIDLPASMLLEALERVVFAISDDGSRFTLKGALMEIGSGKLEAVATDSHRLSLVTREIEADETIRALVPKPAIALLARAADGAATIRLAADDNHLFFRAGDRVVVARKLTGNFPDYKRILPKHESTLAVSRDALLAATGRALQFTDERSRVVIYDVSGESVTVCAQNTERGEADEEIPVSRGAGAAVRIGLNGTYITEWLRAAAPGDVELRYRDEKSAVELREITGGAKPEDAGASNEAWRYIVMPMQI